MNHLNTVPLTKAEKQKIRKTSILEVKEFWKIFTLEYFIYGTKVVVGNKINRLHTR